MKNINKTLIRLIISFLIFTLANIFSIVVYSGYIIIVPILIITFVIINIFPSLYNRKLQTAILRICGDGLELLWIFIISTAFSLIYSIIGFIGYFNIGNLFTNPKLWIINTFIVILIESIVFWNGIIRVYTTSVQLGVKKRVIGLICGWIPVLNLFALGMIIKTVTNEVSFENNKILINKKREDLQICKTKYPILLVHGVFFRDFRYLNYWGRIPKELKKNGATIFYGNHQSACSVAHSGEEIINRIKEILVETGAEKVNIIAHSKGGLDCRYAISMLGGFQYVASLTTINTPHYGCEFADYLLFKIPEKQKLMVAKTYNETLKRLGDTNPDFILSVTDLTATACKERNKIVKDVEGVYYQSIGSKLNIASSGKFPLNFSYKLVKKFDGANDGLVGENSFKWGESFKLLKVNGRRGISHGDMIDLNRENLDKFDVREFYVQLVNSLKLQGF